MSTIITRICVMYGYSLEYALKLTYPQIVLLYQSGYEFERERARVFIGQYALALKGGREETPEPEPQQEDTTVDRAAWYLKHSTEG